MRAICRVILAGLAFAALWTGGADRARAAWWGSNCPAEGCATVIEACQAASIT